MPIQPMTGLQPEDFVPEDQEGDGEPTSFRIQPLNGEQFNNVMALFQQLPDGQMTYSGQAITLCLRYGLTDWSNFGVKFSVHNHKLIPAAVRTAIFARIIEISSLDEDEIKN